MATIADLLHPANQDVAEEVKPMPKRLHAIVQQRIIFLLARELGLDLVLPELAVAVLDEESRNLVPDVIVLGASARFENGILISGADLAVEIMSPKQTFSSLVGKCERLLASGIVPACWLIWPEHGTAYTYDLHHGLSQETSTLHSSDTTIALLLEDVVGNLPTDRE